MATDWHTAMFQEANGIKLPKPEKAEELRRASELAVRLIQVIALELSGSRDGDGFWHGSDAVEGTLADLAAAHQRYIEERA